MQYYTIIKQIFCEFWGSAGQGSVGRKNKPIIGICINPNKDKLLRPLGKKGQLYLTCHQGAGWIHKGWYRIEDFASVFAAIQLDTQQEE